MGNIFCNTNPNFHTNKNQLCLFNYLHHRPSDVLFFTSHIRAIMNIKPVKTDSSEIKRAYII